jgi:hypothetical protein
MMLALAYTFLAVFFLFSPSFITFLLSSAVFDRWKKFASRAVPMVSLLTLIILKNTIGSGNGPLNYGEPLVVLFFILLYGWFFMHSLTLIIVTAVRERRNKIK